MTSLCHNELINTQYGKESTRHEIIVFSRFALRISMFGEVVSLTHHIGSTPRLTPCGLLPPSGSTLAHVKACCLMASRHYLNQCWLLISEVLWHSSQSNFTAISQATILYKFQDNIFKILATGANQITRHWITKIRKKYMQAIHTLLRYFLLFILDSINEMRPKPNGRPFVEHILKCIFFHEKNLEYSFRFHCIVLRPN